MVNRIEKNNSFRLRLRNELLETHARIQASPYRSLQKLIMNLFFMGNVKKFSFAVSTLAVVLIGTAVFNMAMPAHSAQARELVERSMAKVLKITPEMRQEIEARIKADMEATLKEARAAKDLRTITKEEAGVSFDMPEDGKGKVMFTHKVGVGEGFGTSTGDTIFAAGGAIKGGEKVLFLNKEDGPASAGVAFAGPTIKEAKTYLAYTDTKGRSVVIGLDDEDTVVMKMVKMTGKDMGPEFDIEHKDFIKVHGGTPEAGFFIHEESEE